MAGVPQVLGESFRFVSVTAQLVHRGDTGARVRAPFIVLQVLTTLTADRVRVASLTGHAVVGGGDSGKVRVTDLTSQLVWRGEVGAIVRAASAAVQVVWTTGTPDATRQRAWTFDFDGHTFYVLDMGNSGALVYDLVTGQWATFRTAGYSGGWNMKNGHHWRTGGMVVGGAAGSGQLLRLDPGSFFDDGWRPVNYEARGLLATDGTDKVKQYALRLIGSAGVLADNVAPVFHMQFSDDNGQTWSLEYEVALTTTTEQRIEWRSLGAFSAPGRIFRFYDTGGVRFIARVEADLGA